jgi:hypothetical protein
VSFRTHLPVLVMILFGCHRLPSPPADEPPAASAYRILTGLDDLVWVMQNPSTGSYYAVSSGPSRLTLLDSNWDFIESLPLTFTPQGLDVQPGSGNLVLTHDDTLYSILDDRSGDMIQTGVMPHYGGDVVLSPNGWLYAGWGYTIWSRDIRSDSPWNQYADPWDGVAKQLILHPSGDYLYSASTFRSPGALIKYDIRSGAPVPIARVEGNMMRDMWMSGDGEMFISSGTGQVYSGDCAYRGRMSPPPAGERLDDRFTSLAHLASINRIIATRADSSKIYCYHDATFMLKGIIDLPSFPYEDGHGSGYEKPVSGESVFTEPGGEKIWILARALEYWLVIRYDVSAFTI